MARRPLGAILPLLDGEARGGGEPLHRRLASRIREAVLSGALPSGTRLPSSRALARDLRVSRSTVELAFSLLDEEGLVVRRVGSGSVVAIPSHALPAEGRGSAPSPAPSASPRPSRRGERLVSLRPGPEPLEVRPLTPCLPALDEFPIDSWRRAAARASRALGDRLLGYVPAEGLPELRRAIHHYVSTARGVRCDWRQVLVFTSTQQALDAAARVLLDEGDAVWMEEPGYAGARAAFQASLARVVPVPVDAEGLDVAQGQARAPEARLVYCTPSHQYPLGVTMTPARRDALLAWAGRAGAWILEDDYDSEFRYGSRPVASIQAGDTSGRVVYAGTFNKVMFPSLRLAYLVAPDALVDAFSAARATSDGCVAAGTQAAMADFIETGHFGAHLRRMRGLYEERRDALVDGLRRELAGRLEPGPSDAGMHLTAGLVGRERDVEVRERAARRGLDPRALSPMFAAEPAAHGLVLGFSGVGPAALRRAAVELARALTGDARGPPARTDRARAGVRARTSP